MSRIQSFLRRHKTGLVVAVVVVSALVWAVARVLPSSTDGMRRSAAVVETRSCWELEAGGRGVLWFAAADSDSTLLSPSTLRGGAEAVSLAGGCWMNRWPAVPSCRGRLVTVLPRPVAADIADSAWAEPLLRRLLEKARRDIGDSLQWARSEDSELQYYLRVHGVQDEGYQQIASIAATVKAKLQSLERTAATVDSLLDRPAIVLTLRRKTTYLVHYRNGDGKLSADTCRLVCRASGGSLSLLQTLSATTPTGVKAQYLLPWNTTNHRLMAVGFGGLGVRELATTSASPLVIEGRRKGRAHNFPRVVVAGGCPLFTPRGLFAGIVDGQEIDGRGHVSLLMMKGGWR